MRAYYFGNMYLSSIQQGIQAAHATHELFTKYRHTISGEKTRLLYEWAESHKTMILLNGGYLKTIQDLVNFLDSDENPYPWAPFHEGEDSLGGVLTTVSIVLPEKIYLTAAAVRNERPHRAGVTTVRELLEKQGSYTVGRDNTLGFDVQEQTSIEISKWEYDLINRLNQFSLAR